MTCEQKGYWAYEKDAISKRAADLRSFLLQRPEKQVRVLLANRLRVLTR